MLLRDLIRVSREKQLLSQEKLAQIIDVSSASISHIENGTIPRAKTLRKLSHALNINIDTMLACDDIMRV